MGSAVYNNHTAAVGNGVSEQTGPINHYRLIIPAMNREHWAGDFTGAGLYIIARQKRHACQVQIILFKVGNPARNPFGCQGLIAQDKAGNTFGHGSLGGRITAGKAGQHAVIALDCFVIVDVGARVDQHQRPNSIGMSERSSDREETTLAHADKHRLVNTASVKNCHGIISRVPVTEVAGGWCVTETAFVPADTSVVPCERRYLGIKHGVVHQEPVAEQDGRPNTATVFVADGGVIHSHCCHPPILVVCSISSTGEAWRPSVACMGTSNIPGFDPDNASIPELIRASTAHFADHDAIRDGDVTLTYQQLGDRVDQAARALVASGIQAGDTIAVWAPNCWQWVVSALAVSRAGAVLVPINTRFKGNEAAYVLNAASVKMLFVADGFLDTDYSGSLANQETPKLTTIDLTSGGAPGTINFDDFLARGDGLASAGSDASSLQAEVEQRTDAFRSDDVGLIMFTSGTTGHPKGVQIVGGAIIRAFHPYGEALGVQPKDPYLLVNPYFHAFGYNSGVIVCLMFGAVNLPVAIYDAGDVLATIERERVAVFPGPPALFQGLLNHPDIDRFDLSSLRSCVTGAASIPVEMIVDMRDRLGFDTIVTAYGMTETSGLAAYTRPGDSPELIASTSGCAAPGVELRVVDLSGVDVDPGVEGELWVRGFQVTPGYLDAPEQTAEAIDADGWLHTGDIAVMDEQGYIDITDRMKDMFIVGGFNAYPAEIERMLLEHPLVGMAAVIGVPDDRMGEVGTAFIVPSPQGAPKPDELITWCREYMANYKVPRHVFIVDDLPLTASNKVRKPDLRTLATNLLSK